MTPRLAALRDRIQLLAAIDPDLQIFGASKHRYRLATPLDDDGIAGLEAQFGALPDDYRTLIRAFGVCCAGPYYGLEEPRVVLVRPEVGREEQVAPLGVESEPASR